jgi:hypothetical protein
MIIGRSIVPSVERVAGPCYSAAMAAQQVMALQTELQRP